MLLRLRVMTREGQQFLASVELEPAAYIGLGECAAAVAGRLPWVCVCVCVCARARVCVRV